MISKQALKWVQTYKAKLLQGVKAQGRRLSEKIDWPRLIRVRHIDATPFYKGQIKHPITIAHLSDQHVGQITPMVLQRAAVDITNDLNPDIVVLTGDFVCYSELFLNDLTFLISQFQAPVYCVLGNHDHWSNPSAVTKALEQAGAKVLENTSTIIQINGQTLQIVGVDDPYTDHHDLEKATKDMKQGIPTLGLSHLGDIADTFWQRGIPLVLSGHTHAGQITFARLNELIIGKIAGHKYIHGLYHGEEPHHKACGVYISAGIGSSVVPFRLGEKAMREITIFNLNPNTP